MKGFNGVSKDIATFLSSEGFHIVRQKNHAVWSDGTNRIVTAVSASDKRAFDAVKSQVRRLKRKEA